MKKTLSVILALALCLSMATTVLAADNYVPSIGDKNEPKLDEAVLLEGDTVVETIPVDHLVVTPVNKAETSDAIPDAAQDELLSVYDALKNGSMKLPYDKVGMDASAMEIRDLFDVSLICNDGHLEKLDKEEIDIRLTFDLGVSKGTEVVAMVYVDGQWVAAKAVTNNGDGKISFVFAKLCPVVLCVKAQTPPAQTGDVNRNAIAIWGTALGVSALALIALFVVSRKKAEKK